MLQLEWRRRGAEPTIGRVADPQPIVFVVVIGAVTFTFVDVGGAIETVDIDDPDGDEAARRRGRTVHLRARRAMQRRASLPGR